ncbi:MAG: hypothetical protein M3141_10175, partial [Actinomycetota bacterium]|nr:hypothetical protein [Actinomycetota bacterium]
LWREDRAELARLEELQTNKASAEEVLHPPGSTRTYASPDDLRAARENGELEPLPPTLGFRIDRRMGELARRAGAEPARYRALRPEAVHLARWMGARVREISGVPAPLTMTSAVRDQRYQELLVGTNREATSGYSLHTTGYAFDVLRRYRSRSQAVAFQFVLDRLQSLNLIAWVREPAAIHVTVARDAAKVPG